MKHATKRPAFAAAVALALSGTAAGAQTAASQTMPSMPTGSHAPAQTMPGTPAPNSQAMPGTPMPQMQTMPGIPPPGAQTMPTISATTIAPSLGMPRTPPRVLGAGPLETFAAIGGKTPIGIVLSQDGRVFMSFPRAMDPGAYSVAEIVNGRPVPYPNAAINRYGGGPQNGKLVSVQGITIDKQGRLWLLDTGVIGIKPTQYGGPKLLAVDIKTNRIVKTIVFDRAVAGPNAYLNDVRVSLETGKAGTAFITDSSEKGPNGIVVVDFATGKARRRLNDHPSTKAEPNFVGTAEGKTIVKRPPHGPAQKDKTGADGIALRGDGRTLYYCPNQGLHLYGVSVATLADMAATEAQVAQAVQDLGAKPGPSDGIECDSAGHVYVTDWEHNAVYQYTPGGAYRTVAQAGELVWPDSLAISGDGYLYITATQLDRQAKYNKGVDVRHKPIKVYRVKVDAQPVLR